MVRIRLTRVGTRNAPCYRIVVADQDAPRDGRFIETIGTFNPLRNPVAISLDFDRLEHWQKQGAQLSDVVRSIVKKAKKSASISANASI